MVYDFKLHSRNWQNQSHLNVANVLESCYNIKHRKIKEIINDNFALIGDRLLKVKHKLVENFWY